MEETWEFAALAMLERTKFSIDFSKAYGRFTYFASLSIFLSVLKLEQSSSFFGIKSASISERWVETAFFLAGLTLGWNYLTRFMDEKRVFLTLDAGVSAARQEVKRSSIELSEQCASVESSLTEFEHYLAIYENLLRQRGIIKFVENGLISTTQIEGKRVPDYKISDPPSDRLSSSDQQLLAVKKIVTELANIPDNLGDIGVNIDRLTDEVVLTRDKVQQLLSFILNPVNYVGWAKWRFFTIEVLLPLFLFISMVWAYLFPNEVFGFIEWFGNITIMND